MSLKKAVSGLDPLERKIYLRQKAKGESDAFSMRLLVGSVENDWSQLSPGLRAYAVEQGWVKKPKILRRKK